MTKNNNKLIIVAALIIVGVAAMLNLNSHKKEASSEITPFSTLALDEFEKVEIVKGSDSVTLTKGKGGKWGVVEKGDYPLDEEKLRKLIYSLVDLKTVDRLTDNPEKYSKMGLGESPEGGLVKLTGSSGADLGRLLVGSRRQGGRGQYVRVGNDPAVYMVSSGLSFNAKPKDWLDSTLLEAGKDKLLSITVTHEEDKDSFSLHRKSAEEAFQLEGEEKELLDSKVNNLAGALTRLVIEDVYRDDDPTVKKASFSTKALFQAEDGMEYSLSIAETDNGCYIRSSIPGESDTANGTPKVDDLLEARVFQVSKYSCDKIRPKREELLKK